MVALGGWPDGFSRTKNESHSRAPGKLVEGSPFSSRRAPDEVGRLHSARCPLEWIQPGSAASI
jgi:hypothetical protein